MVISNSVLQNLQSTDTAFVFIIRAETPVVYLVHSSVRFLLKQYKHMSTFIRVGQTELAGNLEIKQNTLACMCNIGYNDFNNLALPGR
jgi:hypothetical protein